MCIRDSYYTGNVSDDTLVKRLDKAGVEFKSQIPDTASSLIMDIFITVILPDVYKRQALK